MIKEFLEKMFPVVLHESKYIEATLTISYPYGSHWARYTDSHRGNTWNITIPWKHEPFPHNVEMICEKWYIERRLERIFLGFAIVQKQARVKLDSCEIDRACLFGDGWPDRVYETWEKEGLTS